MGGSLLERARAGAAVACGLAQRLLIDTIATIAAAWTVYGPHTVAGWLAFLGLALLTFSAASTAAVALSGLLLVLSWLGVVLYTMAVSVSTFGVFVLGGSTLIIAASCAFGGACLLSGAACVFVTARCYAYTRSAAESYLRAWGARLAAAPEKQQELRLAAPPAAAPSASPAAFSSSKVAEATEAVANGAGAASSPPAPQAAAQSTAADNTEAVDSSGAPDQATKPPTALLATKPSSTVPGATAAKPNAPLHAGKVAQRAAAKQLADQAAPALALA